MSLPAGQRLSIIYTFIYSSHDTTLHLTHGVVAAILAVLGLYVSSDYKSDCSIWELLILNPKGHKAMKLKEAL